MPERGRRAIAPSELVRARQLGCSQAVRLPEAFSFATKEVFIRQDSNTVDVILSRKPRTWDGGFSAFKAAAIPEDFRSEAGRAQNSYDRSQS